MKEVKYKFKEDVTYNKSMKPATVGSAGIDLRSNENLTISSEERVLIKTGLFIELPSGYEAQIRPRSGLAFKHGITVLNSPGTIDSDYRNEIAVILYNTGEKFSIEKGDRIAQMVIQKVPEVTFVEVEELSETERGLNGCGSTGIK